MKTSYVHAAPRRVRQKVSRAPFEPQMCHRRREPERWTTPSGDVRDPSAMLERSRQAASRTPPQRFLQEIYASFSPAFIASEASSVELDLPELFFEDDDVSQSSEHSVDPPTATSVALQEETRLRLAAEKRADRAEVECKQAKVTNTELSKALQKERGLRLGAGMRAQEAELESRQAREAKAQFSKQLHEEKELRAAAEMRVLEVLSDLKESVTSQASAERKADAAMKALHLAEVRARDAQKKAQRKLQDATRKVLLAENARQEADARADAAVESKVEARNNALISDEKIQELSRALKISKRADAGVETDENKTSSEEKIDAAVDAQIDEYVLGDDSSISTAFDVKMGDVAQCRPTAKERRIRAREQRESARVNRLEKIKKSSSSEMQYADGETSLDRCAEVDEVGNAGVLSVVECDQASSDMHMTLASETGVRVEVFKNCSVEQVDDTCIENMLEEEWQRQSGEDGVGGAQAESEIHAAKVLEMAERERTCSDNSWTHVEGDFEMM